MLTWSIVRYAHDGVSWGLYLITFYGRRFQEDSGHPIDNYGQQKEEQYVYRYGASHGAFIDSDQSSKSCSHQSRSLSHNCRAHATLLTVLVGRISLKDQQQSYGYEFSIQTFKIQV